MCILAVEITGPRWVISVWNNKTKKKNRNRKSKTVSSHKSLVGNLVHLLWAPGQVDIFSSTPSMLRFPNSDVACSSGVHDPRLASTPNCRRCPGLCRSSSLPNHSWISKVFFPSLPNGHVNQFSTCSLVVILFLDKVITTNAHPGGWRLLERSQSRAQFYTRWTTWNTPIWTMNISTLYKSKVAKLNGGRAPSSPLSTSSPTWSPRPQSSPPPQAPFTLLSLISR